MTNETEITESSLSVFPGECAFSALWRYQQRLAMTSSKDRRKRNRYVHSQLPSDLNRLSYTCEHSSHHLIQAHTAWCLYNLTLGNHFGQLLKGAMEKNTPASDIVRLARLPSSKDGSVSDYRLCPECYRSDIGKNGVAYFHTEHQLPGVTACRKHKRLLIRYLRKSEAFRAVFSLHAPKETAKANAAQCEFARFTHRLWIYLSDCKRQLCLRDALRHGLRENHYLYSNKRVDDCRFTKDFDWFLDALNIHPSFSTRGLASRFYHYQQHYPCAPLKALLVLSFLFRDPKMVFQPFCEPPFNSSFNCADTTREEEANIISTLEKGTSISESARLAGRSRCFVKRIARQYGLVDGIELFLGKRIYHQAREMALAGEHTSNIAVTLGISKGAAERVISEDKLVKAFRSIRRFQHIKKVHQKSLISTAKTLGGIVIRERIKKANYAAYYWLFKHDRDWLECHVSPRSVPQNPATRAKGYADTSFC